MKMQAATDILTYIPKNRIWRHVLLWSLLVFGWIAYGAILGFPVFELFVNKLCYLPPQMLATYFLLYYQLPGQVYRGRYLSFSLSMLLSIYVCTVLARLSKVYIYETAMGSGLPKDNIADILTAIPPLIGQYLLWVFLVPVMALIAKLLKDHWIEHRQLEQLRKDKALAELNFLQAQLHPHFLFNTLNNLYTLSIYNSEKTPALILKLSEIVDYMFEECSKDKVPLEKEIQLLQNYIALEQLRYGERLGLTFEHETETPELQISPLILLSIVENAFKHGVSGDLDAPCVRIQLHEKAGQLSFRVYNTKAAVTQVDETGFKKGIGSENIQRQLALAYPGAHQLDIQEEDRSYEVTLEIQLLLDQHQVMI